MFAAFPTTLFVTVIFFARLERSRKTPLHAREKNGTIQGWDTTVWAVSTCLLLPRYLFWKLSYILCLFLLEYFLALFLFSFALYLLLAEAFRTFLFVGGCNTLSDVIVWLDLRGRCWGSFFPWQKSKQSRCVGRKGSYDAS